MRGRLITFEGGEGSGKSTQVARLRSRLEARGLPTVATREPGGSPKAERIRALLLGGRVKPFGPFAEALLFAAARADHVKETILPALVRGQFVLCDRYVDSTRVYQGLVGQVDERLVTALERLTGDAVPDLTLVLDVPAALGLSRAAHRRGGGEEGDRFEGEGLDYHQRVRDGFLAVARREPGRCIVVPAEGEPDEIEALVWAEVESRLLKPEPRKLRRPREVAGGRSR